MILPWDVMPTMTISLPVLTTLSMPQKPCGKPWACLLVNGESWILPGPMIKFFYTSVDPVSVFRIHGCLRYQLHYFCPVPSPVEQTSCIIFILI